MFKKDNQAMFEPENHWRSRSLWSTLGKTCFHDSCIVHLAQHFKACNGGGRVDVAMSFQAELLFSWQSKGRPYWKRWFNSHESLQHAFNSVGCFSEHMKNLDDHLAQYDPSSEQRVASLNWNLVRNASLSEVKSSSGEIDTKNHSINQSVSRSINQSNSQTVN